MATNVNIFFFALFVELGNILNMGKHSKIDWHKYILLSPLFCSVRSLTT